MDNKFLDLEGLSLYDSKLKEYINNRIDKVINISLFGNQGFSLTGQGNDSIPIWAQNSGFRLCVEKGEQVVKTINSANYKVENGGIFAIQFKFPHTAEENAQLNVGGVLGVLKWEDGEVVTKDNTWQENETVLVCYMSNYWCILRKSPKTISEEKAQELLRAHPIGSIYTSTVDTKPSLLFGGTWEQIKDTFLLTAGDTYNAGEEGGSADAVVVEHNHIAAWSEDATLGDVNAYIPMVDGASPASWNRSGSIKPAGEDGTGKNMPPYLVVYAWKRTA